MNEWTDKFVDDITGGQAALAASGSMAISTGKLTREIHAVRNEQLFNAICKNSGEIGMKVNPEKTQLLCIDPSLHSINNTYINISGKKVLGGEEMKIVGFVFGRKPDLWPHIDHIRKKFSRRVWAIRHLKRTKIENGTLVKIYVSMLRPIIEYACQVYYHMMNKTQADTIEDFQKKVLKIIYGYETSYEKALSESGLERLAARSEKLARDFAHKTANTDRFRGWFPMKTAPTYNLRNNLFFEEEFTQENRLYNSPIHRMRRILNGRNK